MTNTKTGPASAPDAAEAYASLAQRYLDHAATFPVGSLARSANRAEAAKYLQLAARFALISPPPSNDQKGSVAS